MLEIAEGEFVIAGQFFTLFRTEEEWNSYEIEHPEMDCTERPENFPCLATFHTDEHERPYPVFFTAEDLQNMSAILAANQ
jgi:hypothetical protein